MTSLRRTMQFAVTIIMLIASAGLANAQAISDTVANT